MKYKCEKCGVVCSDDYKEVNELNRRIYCNKCVEKMWKEKEEK
ncbi:MAG: hypothetical protein QXO70_01900 [Candidatus Pacearchaeota archaeon]